MPLHKFKTEKRGRCFAIQHDLYIWFVSQVQGSMRKPENLLRRCKCLHIWMWVVFAIIRFLKSIKFLSVKLCNMNHKGEEKKNWVLRRASCCYLFILIFFFISELIANKIVAGSALWIRNWGECILCFQVRSIYPSNGFWTKTTYWVTEST